MISRKSARLIAEVYEEAFRCFNVGHRDQTYFNIGMDRLYDFLFDNDFPGEFCQAVKLTFESRTTRRFKEFVMKIHTGESLLRQTPRWSQEQRETLGQKYLFDLAEAIIKNRDTEERFNTRNMETIEVLISQLELEGYEYKNGKLLITETDVLDTTEEIGTIENLYKELKLNNAETTFHHLKLTEEHYHNSRWSDSISNSRKFLECILREVAATHSSKIKKTSINNEIFSNPKDVRKYLEDEGLLDSKERQTITSVYGLLSETGGHPYMAESEEARLLRHLSLTFSQFVMLRLRGALAKST